MAGIYIHIPFCKKACTYCDFHFSTSLKYTEEMTDAICRELLLKKDRISGQVGSIYLGGGTPSVLTAAQLNRIFDTLTQHFSIASAAEITIETNPDDLNASKLAELKQLPVNRFSIGTQSFFDEDLRWMNRAHNAAEAESSIKRSQDAGFENLSIDLIYGYPILTDQKWEQNISTAIDLGVPHISAYSLTVEPKTALAANIKKGRQIPISDDQSAEQFQTLIRKLALAGFEHYEISNYALPGRYAVHNTNYWRGIPYLGIGPSAHGFDGTNRYHNIANNAIYLEKLDKNQLAESVEELSNLDRLNEYLMTSLRTMWGTDLEKIERDFGKVYREETRFNIKPFLDNHWLNLEENHFRLSPEGKLFADHIASELFLIEEHESIIRSKKQSE
ncbi:radical SAM family heme chaperone HemW [Pedobacter nutrimenti]|jgi:oxygen-independent coproporphyrinogen-3 oxidase|uniref:Heme chaperone HemW n=1 Tax=Pedobacter nutrimenti TaxID=1241337 RepID=A0A318UJF1_9SPHI|nr:radical SAM family heme chaperone HemW [Pedobacter nutrimenti]PYF76111.1 oxygen-independent coproporphyrinogen-3 oxidase [Pedobacter nutrimenti]